jgi:Tfp pilus assembly protein PilF
VKIGEIQYNQHKDDLAGAQLKTALKTEGPHQARAHYLLAFIQYRNGDSPGALKEFSEAARLAPDMAEAYYHMGEINEATNHADLAKKNYERALEIRPSYTEAAFAIRKLETRAH